jgi:hypothetical protein
MKTYFDSGRTQMVPEDKFSTTLMFFLYRKALHSSTVVISVDELTAHALGLLFNFWMK